MCFMSAVWEQCGVIWGLCKVSFTLFHYRKLESLKCCFASLVAALRLNPLTYCVLALNYFWIWSDLTADLRIKQNFFGQKQKIKIKNSDSIAFFKVALVGVCCTEQWANTNTGFCDWMFFIAVKATLKYIF